MPRHVKSSMRPTATVAGRVVPSTDVLKSEYCSKYLESLGANPTNANVATLLKELPIEKALLVPIWTKGEVAIFPGMANARKSDQEYIVKSLNSTGQQEDITEEIDGIPGDQINDENGKNEEANINIGDVQENQLKINQTLKDEGPTKATMAQVPKTETPSGRKISWSTVHTLNLDEPLLDRGTCEPLLRPSEVQTEEFKKMLVPPSYRKSDADGSIMLFTRNLGSYAPRIKDDKTGDTFNEVKKVISSSQSITLYQKLLEYAYWNVIHPWANDIYTRANHYTNVIGPTPGITVVDIDDNVNASTGLRSAAENASSPHNGEEVEPSLAGTEASMNSREKEKLFLEVQEAMLVVKRKIGTTKKAVVTSLQCLVCLCHYFVDDMLTIMYPWFDAWEPITTNRRRKMQRKILGLSKTDSLPPFTERELALHQIEDNDRERKCILAKKVRRLVHQAIAELVDPSRIFTQHLLISNYVGTDQVSLTKSTSRARFYNTSVAVRSILGDATSDASRRFMKYAEPVHLSVPGVATPGVSAPIDPLYPEKDGNSPSSKIAADMRLGLISPEQSESEPHNLSWSRQRSLERRAIDRKVKYEEQVKKEKPENNRMLQLSLVTPLSMTTRDLRRKQTHKSLKHVEPPSREMTVSEKLGLVRASSPKKTESALSPLEEQKAACQARYHAREKKTSLLANTLAASHHRVHHESQLDAEMLQRKVDLNTRSIDTSQHDPYSLDSVPGKDFNFHDIFSNVRAGTDHLADGSFSRNRLVSYDSDANHHSEGEALWKATATGTRDAFRSTRKDFNARRDSLMKQGTQDDRGDDDQGTVGTIGSISAASAGSYVTNRLANTKVSLTTQSRLMDIVVHEKAAAYSDIEIARKRILLNQ